jgi:hypothetical protein
MRFSLGSVQGTVWMATASDFLAVGLCSRSGQPHDELERTSAWSPKLYLFPHVAKVLRW